jgi:hypothetical protein
MRRGREPKRRGGGGAIGLLGAPRAKVADQAGKGLTADGNEAMNVPTSLFSRENQMASQVSISLRV